MGHVRLWEELEEEERPAEGHRSGWQDQECERKEGVCPLRRYDWPGPVSGWRTLLPCLRAWFLLQTQFLQILAQSCFAYFGALPRAGVELGPSRGEKSLHFPGLFLTVTSHHSCVWSHFSGSQYIRLSIYTYLTFIKRVDIRGESRPWRGGSVVRPPLLWDWMDSPGGPVAGRAGCSWPPPHLHMETRTTGRAAAPAFWGPTALLGLSSQWPL